MAGDASPEDEGTEEIDLVLSGLGLPRVEEAEATVDDRAAEQADRVAEAERHRDRLGPGFEPY